MIILQIKLMLESVIISNFISQLFKRKLWMRTAAFAVLLQTMVFAGIKDDTETMIVQHFGSDIEFSFTKYDLPTGFKTPIEREVKQRFYSSFVYIWVVSEEDSIIGYALLDNVKGKSMPITFLVMYNTQGEVAHSNVVKYREPIGGDVGRSSWLEQFIGKSNKSVYDDIDGISGATISVHAVTKGIHKLTLLLDEIKMDLANNDRPAIK